MTDSQTTADPHGMTVPGINPGLSPAVQEYIAEKIAAAPPLWPELKAELRLIIWGSPALRDAASLLPIRPSTTQADAA